MNKIEICATLKFDIGDLTIARMWEKRMGYKYDDDEASLLFDAHVSKVIEGTIQDVISN